MVTPEDRIGIHGGSSRKTYFYLPLEQSVLSRKGWRSPRGLGVEEDLVGEREKGFLHVALN